MRRGTSSGPRDFWRSGGPAFFRPGGRRDFVHSRASILRGGRVPTTSLFLGLSTFAAPKLMGHPCVREAVISTLIQSCFESPSNPSRGGAWNFELKISRTLVDG